MNIKAQNKKFLKLLFVVKKVTEVLSRRIKHNRRGRPRKFNLFQKIACLVFRRYKLNLLCAGKEEVTLFSGLY